METHLKVALIGNPNSGKSSVFNLLTGLNQKIANFPGVTVEKRTGSTVLKKSDGRRLRAEITDLPGTYSLYPKSPEEVIPFSILCDPDNAAHPDLALVVADGTNLKRNLFLCSQILDLKIPVVLVINMMDIVRFKNINIDIEGLSARLGIPVIPMNSRNGEGLDELKAAMAEEISPAADKFIDVASFSPKVVMETRSMINVNSDYNAFLVANNLKLITGFELPEWKKNKIAQICAEEKFDSNTMQQKETLERYKVISEIMHHYVKVQRGQLKSYTNKIDSLLTHRIWGYAIFLGVLLLIFQAIFAWASYPMDLIDSGFQSLSIGLASVLPEGILSDLLINGVLAGLNGIVVFVPQIALLFFFIAILEDTGYMARVSFIMDRLMRKFGLNGKSLIPLISGVACAVPAIMSTRTIQSWKERLITIMVTPLMSCSARLPVYTLLIALIIPKSTFMGFNLQGLVLMMMYMLGFVAAMAAALVMKYIIRSNEKSFFVMELPMYRIPRWSSIVMHLVEKVKIFLFEAGKVIISISIILWVMASFAPSGAFNTIEEKYSETEFTSILTEEEISQKIQSEKLEASYAGRLGHIIEPVIEPLGFDWKIGIALITSFAAREVFVGTMSTIYSVGMDESSSMTVKEKMRAEINPDTGGPRYNFAVGLSLMFFYAFAMQCMSTVAVVYRETRRIRYPLIQVLYLSGLAYISSLIIYQTLS
ncbi:MAG: ferrous iron transport protein B [Bacteroidetes bacterium]|nr:MAG: ferrous iron transport protein B [Bacteroidota bacterium]REK05337.1 MAG: ferrous iron transport protein B [Bacteroidota bacterium]REK36574.1 MAG: ferrous iron transport protein B [Bacteroidota bacterium]REK51734.1 MAG: ferrous iron transport protein B [Bacteroidota bacterium]